MEIVVQALRDHQSHAATMFRGETDLARNIAEDATREALATMGVSGINERLYGPFAYKKAIYAFLPDPHPVALMLDAKAEKHNGNSTATIPMSQTSMTVRMRHPGTKEGIAVDGQLDRYIERGERRLYVVTLVAKHVYEFEGCHHRLRNIIVTCLPNGVLQDRYNPTVDDSFWLIGRNTPSRGEDFRARVSYQALAAKASWRVRNIDLGQLPP